MSWSTYELRVRLAPLNRFKPSSKIFYWLFQGGTSFVDRLCFWSVLCLLCLCARLVICALWSPAGKGLTSWLSFVVSTVSWSLSHWYPRSGVVLDCIGSWSLHPYLLWLHNKVRVALYKIQLSFFSLSLLVCVSVAANGFQKFAISLQKMKFLPNFNTNAPLWKSNFGNPRNINILTYHSCSRFTFYWWGGFRLN